MLGVRVDRHVMRGGQRHPSRHARTRLTVAAGGSCFHGLDDSRRLVERQRCSKLARCKRRMRPTGARVFPVRAQVAPENWQRWSGTGGNGDLLEDGDHVGAAPAANQPSSGHDA